MGLNESEQLRQELIELQVEEANKTTLLTEEQKALEKLFQSTQQLERESAERRAKLLAKRAELSAAESREAALEQAGEVTDEVQRLLQKFQAIAEGKPWYEGIMPHQWEGMTFGAGAKRWICGDEMGLGKTRESIGWLDLVGAKKVLIVCEPNICDQFAGEVAELAPHREIINLYKKTPERRHELLDVMLSKTEAVVIVNYEMWRRDKDALGKLLQWQVDTLIVDEAHNLKTTSTANFRYIEMLLKVDNVCGRCRGLIYGLFDESKKPRKVPKPCSHCGWKLGDRPLVEHRWPLETLLDTRSIKNVCFTTGTPILNSPLDLYSLLHLIDPILFPTAKAFKEAYCIHNFHANAWEFRMGGMERLAPFIRGRYLGRSLKDSGVVLPEQRITHVQVDLDKNEYPLQYRTIKQISSQAQIILDSGEAITIMDMLALITRKRQANVWPGGIEIRNLEGEVVFSVGSEVQESVKMDRVMEKMLFKHAEGKRQIVFSQFKSALSELEDRLTAQGLRVARFDGDTPKHLRTQIKTNFDRSQGEDARWDVVLCNYKTGGSGLNLTAATVTHILDEEWNPGKRNQAYARDHRIGQTEETEVFVYRIPGTVDIWLANILKRKERVVDGFKSEMTESATISRMDFLEALTSGDML